MTRATEGPLRAGAMDQESTPTSDTYVIATVRCLWENLPRVVAVGLWFSILSAPSFVLGVLGLTWPALLAGLLLVGPGWVALLQWEGELLAGRLPAWTALGRSWLRTWLPSVRLGVLALFPPVLVQVWSERLPADAPLWLVGLNVAAWLYALLWPALAVVSVAPALAHHQGDLPAALREGVVLASRFPAHTVGLIALFVLFYFAVAYFSGGLLFFLPAIAGLFVANHYRLVAGAGADEG